MLNTISSQTDSSAQAIINTQDWKDLLNRIQMAEQYTRKWHDNIERWRREYNQQHYRMPGRTNEILYNDPTYTNTVDLAVGIMLGNDLRWHAFGFRPTKLEQLSTGKLEKLIEGILSINNEREEALLIYQLFLNFNRDGGGVFYSVFDPKLATEVIEQVELEDGTPAWQFSEPPIRVKVIDPSSVILLPGGEKRWLMIGRKERRTVLDVETRYGVRIERYGHLSQQEKAQIQSDFYDLWDYVWVDDTADPENPDTQSMGRHQVIRNTIMFENLPIVGPRVMKGYKDLPYTVQFFKPVGEDSGEWQCILSPMESSVSMLERSFNRRAKQIDIFTALPLVAKTQPGRKVVIDPGLYNSITLAPDESIEFPRWPGNAPDMQLHQDFLRARIQQSGFSDVMFGSGNSQVAGYALSQLGDQNRIRMEQPIQHLELLLTAWAKKVIRLLQSFAPHTIISVYGHQKGEDYMDYIQMDEIEGYSIRAEIRPNFPNEEMRKVAMSTQVKGTVSDYTRMEKYLGIEQPEDEKQRMLLEAIERHPVAQMYALIAALKEQAAEGDEVAAMTLQAVQNQGVPGQPGRPQEPSAPEQLTGLASPTGQPPVPGALPPGQSAIEQQNNMSNAAPTLNGEISG